MFNWQIEEYPGSKFKYGIATTTPIDQEMKPTEFGGINGAIMEPTEDFEDTTMITIEVPSIEQYLKKIEEAGGKTLMPKSPVGDMGFMARFLDLEGNAVGLWENKEP